MKYRDFALKIEPKQGDVYPVSVASPAGEGRSSLILPFAPEEVGLVLANLGRTVRGSGATPLRDLEAALATPRASAEEVGSQLFAALFSGPVRSLFDWSLGRMHGTDTGLRIKIHIDATDPSLAQLASLPWEFLYRRETRDWLNLSRYTPIVRYLDVPRPHTPLALDPPLRILVVLSEPVDCRRLDLARERALIEGTWARLRNVEVEFLAAATAEGLGDRLIENPCHIVHYMGHGDFDERTGRGVLLMEDEDGQANPIDGPTLGILLRDVPTLRLVVLNACDTARLAKERGLDPFAGVASSLVMAGIPAVVAMQFPISDSAAITFSQRFYALLARGEAVDTAVAEGRRAVRTSRPDTLEWATPVLFMRAADGVIFRVSGAAAAAGVEQEPASAGEELAQREAEERERQARLVTLFSEATRLATADPDRALEILSDIRREQADYPHLDELEEWARQHVAEEQARREAEERERQARLVALFSEAMRLVTTDPGRALEILSEIRGEQADYPHLDELEVWARQHLVEEQNRREAEEGERQGRLAALVSKAERLVSTEPGRALEILSEIRRQQADYPGLAALEVRARQQAEEEQAQKQAAEEQARREAEERERQGRLAALFSKAERLVTTEPQRALEILSEIRRQQADYPGLAALEARARQQAEEEQARKQAAEEQARQAGRYREQGFIYHLQGNYKRAIAEYNKAIELDPRQASYYRERGLIYKVKGNYDRAMADYDRAIALDPQEADAYHQRGRVRTALGQLKEALADLDRAIALDPQRVLAYSSRAVVHNALGQPQATLADFDRAIALDSQDAVLYCGRGAARYILGRPEEALADYDRAIALNPHLAMAYDGRGTVRYTLGQLKEALADYDRAIALDPQFASAYSFRGRVRTALGRPKEALADHNRAIALNPQDAIAYTNRGLAREALGQLKEALADHDRAIALNPQFAAAYYNRGRVRHALGQREAAQADYDRAAALDPQQAWAPYTGRKRGR
jgi:tetratricopeptide (TPR) repeat protein